MMLMLVGCGGASTTTQTTTAAEKTEETTTAAAAEETTEEVSQETETEAPLLGVDSVQLKNKDGDVTVDIEYRVIQGLTYKELEKSGTPNIKFEYEPENISLTLFITTTNTEGLHKKIDGSDGTEAVEFGDVKGYVEYSTWTASGELEMGPMSDAVSYVVRYDIRRLDTQQAESEEQLRGFIENDAIVAILSSLKIAE